MLRAAMALVFFLVLTVGGGLLIGLVTRTGEWYVKLITTRFPRFG